jgi:hypothetical protein
VDTVRSTTSFSCRLYNGLGIWYKIKPFTNNANLVASTCFYGGADFDTVITVYRGDNCRPSECIAQNDGEGCSDVEFAVSPSTTYWIFVDGYSGFTRGNFQLTVAVGGG